MGANLRLNMMFRTGLLLLVCAVGAHAYSSGFASGSSFSSGYASGSSYSSGYTSGSTPTSSPTPAPAATHEIVATVQLNGISKAQFNAAAQTSFKEVVASNTGSICGSAGTAACTSADVTITSITDVRRAGVKVAFKVKVYSAAKATSGASTLGTFVANAAGFKAALVAKGGALANVTGTAVVSAPVGQAAPTSSPTPTTISGANNMAVVSLVSISCMLLGFTRH